MAKRKLTITIDDDLYDDLQSTSSDNVSAMVNDALRQQLKLRNQMRALKSLLDEWEERLGPIPAEAIAEADALFDELDRAAGLSRPGIAA